MTEYDVIQNDSEFDAYEFNAQIIQNQIHKAGSSLYAVSKSKYDQKAKLIEEAKDMTTKEKLEALDQNYDRHAQEVWQGVIIFGAMSLGVVGLATGGPAIVKNVQRLIA